MSDVNEGSSFGDGNFAEYIARERDRLRAEREQIFNRQKELQRRLDAINREFAALEAYETAKIGKAARQAGGAAELDPTRRRAVPRRNSGKNGPEGRQGRRDVGQQRAHRTC